MSFAVLHRHNASTMLLSGRRIERAAFEVLVSADRLLDEAAGAARELRDDVDRLVQEQRSAAHEIGLREGRADGVLAVLGTLEVERRLRELLASRIADVVEQCVRNLLGDIGPTEVFQRRVRQLLRSAAAGGAATLHVCPAQAHLAQAIVDEQAQVAGAELNWLTVFSDDHCARDSLVLETRVGFVDSSIELTLSATRDIISRAVVRATSELGS